MKCGYWRGKTEAFGETWQVMYVERKVVARSRNLRPIGNATVRFFVYCWAARHRQQYKNI